MTDVPRFSGIGRIGIPDLLSPPASAPGSGPARGAGNAPAGPQAQPAAIRRPAGPSQHPGGARAAHPGIRAAYEDHAMRLAPTAPSQKKFFHKLEGIDRVMVASMIHAFNDKKSSWDEKSQAVVQVFGIAAEKNGGNMLSPARFARAAEKELGCIIDEQEVPAYLSAAAPPEEPGAFSIASSLAHTLSKASSCGEDKACAIAIAYSVAVQKSRGLIPFAQFSRAVYEESGSRILLGDFGRALAALGHQHLYKELVFDRPAMTEGERKEMDKFEASFRTIGGPHTRLYGSHRKEIRQAFLLTCKLLGDVGIDDFSDMLKMAFDVDRARVPTELATILIPPNLFPRLMLEWHNEKYARAKSVLEQRSSVHERLTEDHRKAISDLIGLAFELNDPRDLKAAGVAGFEKLFHLRLNCLVPEATLRVMYNERKANLAVPG